MEGAAEREGDLLCSREPWKALGLCNLGSNKKTVRRCASYFLVTQIEHLLRINLREESVFWLMIGGDTAYYGGYIRYILGAVIKHQRPTVTMEEIWRGRATGGWSRKPRDHIFKHMQEAESKLKRDQAISSLTFRDALPPAGLYLLPKGSMTPLKSAIV